MDSSCDDCWSDSNCDDPLAHCAAQGDAVWDVGRLGLECPPGRRQHESAAITAFRALIRPARECLTHTLQCGRATKWHTGGRAVARDPACAKSRGLDRMEHSSHSLRAGGGLRVEAAASDSATAPSAKIKCASQACTHEVQLHTSQSCTGALLLLCPMQHRYIGQTAPLTAFSCGEQVPDASIPHYTDARMQHSQSRQPALPGGNDRGRAQKSASIHKRSVPCIPNVK